MMKRILSFLGIVALGGSALAQQPADVSKTLAPFQGTWSLVMGDAKAPPGGPKAILLTITGDRYAQVVDGTVTERGTLKIDTTAKPMTIDLSIQDGADAGKLQVGLIELSGATLTLHLGFPGSTTRPTSMAPAPGFLLFTMKKTK
jgi:uncharacterized protein (TIGR03067 family)